MNDLILKYTEDFLACRDISHVIMLLKLAHFQHSCKNIILKNIHALSRFQNRHKYSMASKMNLYYSYMFKTTHFTSQILWNQLSPKHSISGPDISCSCVLPPQKLPLPTTTKCFMHTKHTVRRCRCVCVC
jgi:hypothetical protein